jgi:hypothetical protein
VTGPRPPRRDGRGTYRSAAIVGGLALLLIIIRLVTGSSGQDNASGGDTSAPPPPAAGSGGPASASSAAGLTCAAIKADPRVDNRIDFRTGGTLPSDVPAPAQPPALTCRGTADKTTVIAAAWPNLSVTDYIRQLDGLGWRQGTQGSVQRFDKPGAEHAILVYTQSGELVALFGPPPQG